MKIKKAKSLQICLKTGFAPFAGRKSLNLKKLNKCKKLSNKLFGIGAKINIMYGRNYPLISPIIILRASHV